MNEIKLAEDTFFIPSENNALIWENTAFDPSIDIKYFADKSIETVYISHGHADHFRQASYLRKRGAKVFASKKEAIFIEDPSINVRAMFSWAALPPEMVTRFFRGESCIVDEYTENDHNSPIKTISLPGHSVGHVGFLLPNNVMYSGDAIWQKKMWGPTPLPYMIDIEQIRKSLYKLKNIEYDILVPAHGKPLNRDESIEHIDYELERLEEIDQIILDLLKNPIRTEDLAKKLSYKLNLLDRLNQYWLTLVVLKSFLCGLYERNLIECSYEDYQAKWKIK